jgi:hypothetical protein
VFAFAFASEIGPDFSPDIFGAIKSGLQPLGHAFVSAEELQWGEFDPSETT